ncbi:unnamed protein product [Acanthoscelides obtectus]|uniref:Uncharacterized protein n=1 Tax=Acanthoscelides obtectus TaxID=200917 RepID=A0A9P0P2Y2_ACAOB|nr:unnamed protein product [Acanthoscelides obtectus]CAK1647221.1 hypothetical protein AOBTE_LOCUS15118 [Acanthoscelides obtectus]
MADSKGETSANDENYRNIEDIIDSRKLLGQYNAFKHSNGINFRYAYSSSCAVDKYDDTVAQLEGDTGSTYLKLTDSEITVIRVKCSDLSPKTFRNFADNTKPGDGVHLGDSNPSMVNLVTLIGAGASHPLGTEEYLIPLSSWDHYLKLDDVVQPANEGKAADVTAKPDALTVQEENENMLLEKRLSRDCACQTLHKRLFIREPRTKRMSRFILRHCSCFEFLYMIINRK